MVIICGFSPIILWEGNTQPVPMKSCFGYHIWDISWLHNIPSELGEFGKPGPTQFMAELSEECPGVLRSGVPVTGTGWRKGDSSAWSPGSAPRPFEPCAWGREEKKKINQNIDSCYVLAVRISRQRNETRVLRAARAQRARCRAASRRGARAQPALARAPISSLASLCWESRSRLCLKNKQKCTWAVFRNVD